MRYQTFEDFLEEYHAENIDEGSSNGDMMQDHYERWIENLDTAEVMEFAEKYGKNIQGSYNLTIEKVQKVLTKYCDPKPEFSGIPSKDVGMKIIDELNFYHA